MITPVAFALLYVSFLNTPIFYNIKQRATYIRLLNGEVKN
jgi:hypothetical protein